MLFSSATFLIFFIPYLFLHRFTPARYRNYVIIVGSLIFYAWWRPGHIWVPIMLICIAYGGSLALKKANGSSKRLALATTIVALCAPLIFFKYSTFLTQAAQNFFHSTSHTTASSKPIPLAISFITFTLIAFIVDTYI